MEVKLTEKSLIKQFFVGQDVKGPIPAMEIVADKVEVIESAMASVITFDPDSGVAVEVPAMPVAVVEQPDFFIILPLFEVADKKEEKIIYRVEKKDKCW